MSRTVAFLAECQGSPSIQEQEASLDLDDQVVVAGKRSFAKLLDLLAGNGLRLGVGDRIKVFDLSCISLSTPTLIGVLTKILRRGITFEVVTSGLVIEPVDGDKALALLKALDGHYRYQHGVKTHPTESASRGRKRLLDPDQLQAIRAKLDSPGVTATDVAQELGVARSTLFNFLERFGGDRRVGRGKKVEQGSGEGPGDDTHVV